MGKKIEKVITYKDVPFDTHVEKIIHVPKVEFVDKYVEVPVIRTIQKFVEIPQVVTVQKIVDVPKDVEIIVEVEQSSAGSSSGRQIRGSGRSSKNAGIRGKTRHRIHR